MNKIISTFAFVCFSVGVYAQETQYNFTYDASGNCTLCTTYKSNSSGPVIGKGDEELDNVSSLSLCGKPIAILSENGGNSLVVEVAGLEPSDDCTITLYDLSGKQLSATQAKHVRTTIDTSKLKTSTYLVGIVLNDEKKGIKFTKE